MKGDFAYSGSCNFTKFKCSGLPGSHMLGFAEFGYDLIIASYRHLILSLSAIEDAEIFLYDYSTTQKILAYNLEDKTQYRMAPKLV